MYYYVSGTLVENQPSFTIVDCAGMGYKCNTSFYTARQLPEVGEFVRLYTHFVVREDTQELYGFFDRQELELFRLLISVSGVGPKAGMSLLSDLSPDSLILAIISGDARALTKAVGIGKKTADRIVLELKDTLGKKRNIVDAAQMGNLSDSGGNAAREAVSALMVLGYSKNDAVSALSKVDSELSLEEMIRQALKQLM